MDKISKSIKLILAAYALAAPIVGFFVSDAIRTEVIKQLKKRVSKLESKSEINKDKYNELKQEHALLKQKVGYVLFSLNKKKEETE